MSRQNSSFIVDAMLGNIAKKLRLLGFDTKYYSDIEDDDLLEIAKNENRIIVTKDMPLIERVTKLNLKKIPITASDEIEQLLKINEFLHLKKFVISGDSCRCPVCNGVLKQTEKNLVLESVPINVLEINEKFWICTTCKKIYWEGTHIKNLQKFIEKLNEKL